MSEAEQQHGLRIQELESKLEELEDKFSGLDNNPMFDIFLKDDIIRMLEDFRRREIKGDVDKEAAEQEDDGDADDAAPEEELDEFQFINIESKKGTPFKVHWISIDESETYSSCADVVSKEIAEAVFLEAVETRRESNSEINNGDLLFLLCRPELPESGSSNTGETENCTYIGLYLDISGGQDEEPESSTEDLITVSLTEEVPAPEPAEGEEAAEPTENTVASVFVWEECTCKGTDPDNKINVPTVSTTTASSSSGYVITGTSSGSSSGTSFYGLGEPTITPNVCLLSTPKNVGASSKSLTLKPVNDVSITSSSIDLFSTKCGTLSKEDGTGTSTSNVLSVSIGSSPSQFQMLGALTEGSTVSLGGQDIRAFTPLIEQPNAANVASEVESVVLVKNPDTNIPITSSSETADGVTTTTYTLHLANQTHYSGITTQEENTTSFDIVTQTLEAPDNPEPSSGVSGSLSLLSSFDVTMESEFVETEDGSGGTSQEAIHKIYKTKVTRANISWIDGVLTGLGTRVSQEDILVGVIRVPNAPDAYKCTESGQCVKDASGEYTTNNCDNACQAEVDIDIYAKNIFGAYADGSANPFTHTINLSGSTTKIREMTVNFSNGENEDRLIITDGTTVLLDTQSNPGVPSEDSNAAYWNSRVYSYFLPVGTSQIVITVEPTEQSALGLFSDTGWFLSMHETGADESEITTAENDALTAGGGIHDFAARIKWRHNADCSACEQFELQHPANPDIDGQPGTHYFDDLNSCNASVCEHP